MKKAINILTLIVLCTLIICLFLENNGLLKQNEKLMADNNQLLSDIANSKKNLGIDVAKAYCGNCHRFKFKYETDHLLTGIVQRVGENYLRLFITKQDSLMSAHNEYAINMKKEFNNMGYTHNFKLTDSEMSKLIEFLK